MSLISRLINVFRADSLDSELDEEFRFHIEERVKHLIAGGMDAGEAGRFARRQFGNRALLRETSHDAKVSQWFESVLRDVRYGRRLLWKDRAAMAPAALSLALALGACATAFSLIDALVLRPPPVSHPEQLFALAYPDRMMNAPPGVPREHDAFSYPLYQRLRETAGPDIDLFGANLPAGMQAIAFDDGGGDTETIRPGALSGNGFGVLGIRPALGRLFGPADDRPGAPPVAVISYNLWTRRFSGDPSVLGRWVSWGSLRFTIVGVTQKSFTGLQPGYRADLWTPLTNGVEAKTLASPNSTWVSIWGRARPGARMQALQVAYTNFRRDETNAAIDTTLLIRPAATGADSLFRRQFTTPLRIFGFFSALLLLIAASNVANLFIARATAREREMALRIAIGAGRRRLVRQLLIESALLTAIACAGAIAITSTCAPFLAGQMGASNFPAYLDVQPDWRLLAFLSVAGILTTMFFGAIPALRVSSVHPDESLKSSAKQSAGTGALRPLLPIQVAFSFMVLFLSGMLLESFEKLIHVDLGFSKDHVILFTLDTKTLASRKQLVTQLTDRIRRLNGVKSVALSQQGLIGGAFAFVMTPSIRFPGRDIELSKPVNFPVSPRFFETMQIRLLEGRDFEPRDVESETSSAVIVNEAFVQQYLPSQNPIGQRFELTGDDRPSQQQIVGVAANSLFNNLREPPRPSIYSPLRSLAGATLEVRTGPDPMALATSLRREIESVTPGLWVRSSILQTTRIEDTLVSERLLAWIAAFFAISAVVLVAVGLHGVISYFVVRRTREIGIRMALGAERPAVVRFVIRDVAILICVGMITGAACGIALSSYLTSLLFDVQPTDVSTLIAPLAAILMGCVLAALRPAMRAARVDPVIALRYE